MTVRAHPSWHWWPGAIFLVVAIVVVALDLGPTSIHLRDLASPTAHDIIWQARLPRVLLALCVGAGLSVSGVAYQALLNNPLADPYILGVAGGAALGSAIGVVLQLPFSLVMVGSFAGSLLTMATIVVIARGTQRHMRHSLLLTGAVCNAFAFAVIMLLHTLIPTNQGQEILFLLMGTLALATPQAVPLCAAMIGLGSGVLWWRAHQLDALVLGDDVAQTMGVPVRRLQWEIFIAGSLVVGAVVAASGLIGFVGLFVPHAVRRFLGHSHRRLLPMAALVGAGFLVVADLVARTLLRNQHIQTELPVGVVTALIGAPSFIWLMRRY